MRRHRLPGKVVATSAAWRCNCSVMLLRIVLIDRWLQRGSREFRFGVFLVPAVAWMTKVWGFM